MTPLTVDVQLDRGQFALDARFETTDAVTGVFGHSGAGKSTLINLIAGLQRPDRGRIAIGAHVLFDGNQRIDLPAHRRRIGVVFQEHRLFPHRSVAGNLRYGWRLRPADQRRFTFDEITALLELSPLLDRRTDKLSGGERQRVALGRALLSSPRLLLLDEPLASLDRRLRQQIIPFLMRVRDELRIPMLMVSHDLAEILQLTDDLLVMRDGRTTGHGAYRELVSQDAASEVFDDRDIVNVLRLRIEEHHPADGNTVLRIGESSTGGQRIVGPLTGGSAGNLITATLAPSDIALAAGAVPAVSIQNQINGMVKRIATRPGHALVEIDIGTPILAKISLKSLDTLSIRPDGRVICLFKSNALQYRIASIENHRA